MVPPPKRVDAVEVHNTTEKPLKFKVIYDNHKDKAEIEVEHTVAPGAKHVFGEKELDMGGWKAVAPVVRVGVEGGGSLAPAVSGIVKLLRVAAGPGGGGVALSQEP